MLSANRECKTKVLFIHQNFPGQFRRIAAELAAHPAYEVWAVGASACPGLPAIPTFTYKAPAKSGASTHQYVRSFEQGVR